MPVIEVKMWTGRSAEQKKELAESLTKTMAEIGQVSPQSVTVLFVEIEPENWAVGGKLFLTKQS
ncbi:MAG: 2-hydroxymuconate tautomerase family protein [Firmicutes bacterium]|mgnify:CR=1 FL=1|nr:2-hydroxymuconate tautomerase family protein [Bacillota bacterium]